MIRKDTDELITFLNALAMIDPVTMGNLVNHRVLCNEGIAQHRTVQTGKVDDEGAHEVGMLGILNGYCGVFDEGPFKGWGPIAAIVDQDGSVISFCRTDSKEAAESMHKPTT